MPNLRGVILQGTILVSLLAWGEVGAQGVLVGARAHVSVVALDGMIQVETTYLVLPEPGTPEIPLSLLTPDPTTVASLKAFLHPAGAHTSAMDLVSPGIDIPDFGLALTRDHYWEGTVPLPPDLSRENEALALTFSYEVRGAWGGSNRVTVPLVVPLWVPADPTPRTFEATIQLPMGSSVTSSFPTSLMSQPSFDSGAPYELALQAVPAMLVLRVTLGEKPFLTLEGSLDLVVLLILLAMGLVGARYLRAGPNDQYS